MTTEEIDAKIAELEAKIGSAEVSISHHEVEIVRLKSLKRRIESGEWPPGEDPPDPEAWHR